MEEGEGAGGGFIGEELGEGEAGTPSARAPLFRAGRTLHIIAAGAAMIVDGGVEELPASAAGMIVLAVAGDAMAGAHDGSPILRAALVPCIAASAGEFFDVEVEESAWVGAFIAHDRRGRGKVGYAQAMAAQKARGRTSRAWRRVRSGSLGACGGGARARKPVGLARPPSRACPLRRLGGSEETFWGSSGF